MPDEKTKETNKDGDGAVEAKAEAPKDSPKKAAKPKAGAKGRKKPAAKVKVKAAEKQKQEPAAAAKAGVAAVLEKSKEITRTVVSKFGNKKVLAVFIIVVLILAAIGIGVSISSGSIFAPQKPPEQPSNNTTKPVPPPLHKEYDTPALTGVTPGGLGVYQYDEQKFAVEANATKLTAKLDIKDESALSMRHEVYLVIKDSSGKQLGKTQAITGATGSITLTNTTLAAAKAGQFTSRVEVYKGINVVCHVTIDVIYNSTSAAQGE